MVETTPGGKHAGSRNVNLGHSPQRGGYSVRTRCRRRRIRHRCRRWRQQHAKYPAL